MCRSLALIHRTPQNDVACHAVLMQKTVLREGTGPGPSSEACVTIRYTVSCQDPPLLWGDGEAGGAEGTAASGTPSQALPSTASAPATGLGTGPAPIAAQPLTFILGRGEVPAAVDETVQGMAVGERCAVMGPAGRLLGNPEGAAGTVRLELELLEVGTGPAPGRPHDVDERGQLQALVDGAVDDRQSGNACLKEGDLKQAKQFYCKSIARCTKLLQMQRPALPREAVVDCLVSARANLSLCYFKLGRYRKSCAQCSKVLKRDPKNVKALYRRAQAYTELEDYGLAQEDVARCLAIAPDNTEAQKLGTRVAVRMQRHNQKEKTLYSGLFK